MDTLLEQFRKKPKVMERDRHKINIPVSGIEENKEQPINEENEENEMDELQQKIKGEDSFKIIDNTKILKKVDNEKYNELRIKIMRTMPVYKLGEEPVLKKDEIITKKKDKREERNNGPLPGEKLVKVKKRIRKTKAIDIKGKHLEILQMMRLVKNYYLVFLKKRI